MNLWAFEFMRNALLTSLLVGLMAPSVGVFLVQRRLSLVGDGVGHVALAGVALGVLTGSSPLLTALVVAVIAAIAMELIRLASRTSGDVALAVLFYGGIATGVLLLARSESGTPANLTSYLFGSITTASGEDVLGFAGLAVVVFAITWLLRGRLFAVALDEQWSRASGLPVTALNIVLSVLVAVTVVMSMRVVGLLLISAIMILPNASGQLLGKSFASSLRWAIAIGVMVCVGGVVASFYADTPSGASIVLLAIAVFLLLAAGSQLRASLGRGSS